MASPFSSRDHYAIAVGRCFCGKDYTRDDNGLPVHAELAAFHLDIHVVGPMLARQIHADRLKALDAIHAKAADVPAEAPVDAAEWMARRWARGAGDDDYRGGGA